MTERWRPVVGFEDTYLVSSLGRVWSKARNGKAGRMRVLLVNPHGYYHVTLSLGGKHRSRTAKVHALVVEAFIGPRPEKAHVRHLNGDRLDNRLVNLTYGTAAENIADTLRHGRHVNATKTECKRGHPLSGDNVIVSEAPGRRPYRHCRACQQMRPPRSRARAAA